jgi:SAM-dependent methyltransferase
VTAVDLSAEYVVEAGRRAEANGVRVDLVVADGEHLPFADSSFDRLWGNAILHHLDIGRAAGEVRRVLQPGGVAVFCEPWGANPVLGLARRFLPYPGKHRTVDECPLRPEDLTQLRRVFPRLEVRGHQLFSMVRRVVRRGWLTHGLERFDSRLLGTFPGLLRFCRYVVLILRRSE